MEKRAKLSTSTLKVLDKLNTTFIVAPLTLILLKHTLTLDSCFMSITTLLSMPKLKPTQKAEHFQLFYVSQETLGDWVLPLIPNFSIQRLLVF